MTLIEQVQLIFVEVGQNSNKYWRGKLFDNDTVVTEWGRVDSTEQSKTFPGRGKRFLDQKVKEKLRKGYTELKVLGDTGKQTIVADTQLHEIAKKQIKTSSTEVEKLIERLVKANVHKITSSTKITFNAENGTFSTPLGVVTLDAITEARRLLGEITKHVTKDDYTSSTMVSVVNQYLRLIPQNVGWKLDIRNLFPDIDALQKQNDILDSLEASYKACTAPEKKKKSKKQENEPEEKVFSVQLELCDDKEVERIRKKFYETRQSVHASRNLDVVRVYRVTIDSMAEAYKEGRKVGNEMVLWHGTKDANLLSILKCGLKISPPTTAQITGKMFGNGVYFSDQSTKSLNYSSGYWSGTRTDNCFMFLADVAMGKAYTPNSSYERLPKAGYDSTFAKAGHSGVMNNEMIIYKENQCNLTHLVEFSTKR